MNKLSREFGEKCQMKFLVSNPESDDFNGCLVLQPSDTSGIYSEMRLPIGVGCFAMLLMVASPIMLKCMALHLSVIALAFIKALWHVCNFGVVGLEIKGDRLTVTRPITAMDVIVDIEELTELRVVGTKKTEDKTRTVKADHGNLTG
ncbi:MAG: hypothetical protein JWM11_104 [Planctomycetaceae bacterium]|nr:hypothetical protein [Planctomycetaceae bacterium]